MAVWIQKLDVVSQLGDSAAPSFRILLDCYSINAVIYLLAHELISRGPPAAPELQVADLVFLLRPAAASLNIVAFDRPAVTDATLTVRRTFRAGVERPEGGAGNFELGLEVHTRNESVREIDSTHGQTSSDAFCGLVHDQRSLSTADLDFLGTLNGLRASEGQFATLLHDYLDQTPWARWCLFLGSFELAEHALISLYHHHAATDATARLNGDLRRLFDVELEHYRSSGPVLRARKHS
jgi:hypothetical protein